MYKQNEYSQDFCLNYKQQQQKQKKVSKDLNVLTMRVDQQVVNNDNKKTSKKQYTLSFYKQNETQTKRKLIESPVARRSAFKKGKVKLKSGYNYFPALSSIGCDCVNTGGVVVELSFCENAGSLI